MNRFKGYFFILGATAFWGVSAATAKLILSTDIDTIVLVQTRMTISCLVMLSFFLLFKRDVLRVKAKDLLSFALLGVFGSAGSNFTYYYAIKELNVATAILLQYLAPLLVLAYAAVTKDEKLTALKVIAGLVSLAGCFLAVGGGSFSLEGKSTSGLVAGFGSAFTWGFANIMIRRLLRTYSVWTTLMYSFIFASIFWVFIHPPWLLVEAGFSAQTWGMLAVFAIISILIPHSLYYSGVQYLTASRAIITATAEPVIAIGFAFLFLGETLTPIRLAGAVLVIAAIMLLQLKEEPGRVLQPDPLP
jgi:drug/metabolite transporter (DMT)-like permease